MVPLLEITNLFVSYKIYEGKLKVLDGVNFSVGNGEKVGLVGEAGCGKTTTMKTILGLLPQSGRVDGGEIFFNGKDLLKATPREIQNLRGKGISMIFQDPTAALDPVFTVGDQLMAVIRYGSREKMNTKEVKEKALDALREVKMPDPKRILSNYPIQLSGGMRQRVCIAMALATEPELLIADEPTTSLDVTIQDQILKLLHALVEKRGTSVIFITHSLGVVREMADKVNVMYAGSIIESGKTREIFSNPLHPYTIDLMKAIPRLSGGGLEERVPGRIPDYLNPPIGCRFQPRCLRAKFKCSVEKPELVEIKPDHFLACFFSEGSD
ncbi:MAG: ABC transporter ATP-binding protein [Caldiserica bacterium]|jgi:peptide/nickel transport system ATP-binding protein|nr:ABC transporter ATP-binding protein [Caldisericota bacterium]MDH7562257.1 ABC transporter ATP-binding protein [Caldisericota bacterium]